MLIHFYIATYTEMIKNMHFGHIVKKGEIMHRDIVMKKQSLQVT